MQENSGTKPVYYFRATLDHSFSDLIVNEMNLYAEAVFVFEIGSENISENSRITKWKPITSIEILIFIR